MPHPAVSIVRARGALCVFRTGRPVAPPRGRWARTVRLTQVLWTGIARSSALFVDSDPPVIPGLYAGSSVTTDAVRATPRGPLFNPVGSP